MFCLCRFTWGTTITEATKQEQGLLYLRHVPHHHASSPIRLWQDRNKQGKLTLHIDTWAGPGLGLSLNGVYGQRPGSKVELVRAVKTLSVTFFLHWVNIWKQSCHALVLTDIENKENCLPVSVEIILRLYITSGKRKRDVHGISLNASMSCAHETLCVLSQQLLYPQ